MDNDVPKAQSATFTWTGDNLSITVDGLSVERMALVAFHAGRLAAQMHDQAMMGAMQAKSEIANIAGKLQAEKRGLV